jgi:5-(carboxyamino)imidazole ribonucleotide mutase
MAINGSKNAALFAVSILALNDSNLSKKLEEFRDNQTKEVLLSEI